MTPVTLNLYQAVHLDDQKHQLSAPELGGRPTAPQHGISQDKWPNTHSLNSVHLASTSWKEGTHDMEYYKVIKVHSARQSTIEVCSTCTRCPFRTHCYSHSARQSTIKVWSTCAQCPLRTHCYSHSARQSTIKVCSTCAQCPLRTHRYSHYARQSTIKVCSTCAQCPLRTHCYSDQTLVHCAL